MDNITVQLSSFILKEKSEEDMFLCILVFPYLKTNLITFPFNIPI